MRRVNPSLIVWSNGNILVLKNHVICICLVACIVTVERQYRAQGVKLDVAGTGVTYRSADAGTIRDRRLGQGVFDIYLLYYILYIIYTIIDFFYLYEL